MAIAIPGRGPAYPLWRRIQTELNRRYMSQGELARLANEHLQKVDGGESDDKVTSMSLTRLKSTASRNARQRGQRHRVVTAVAAVLDIPEDEALRLAGLVEPESTPEAEQLAQAVDEAIGRVNDIEVFSADDRAYIVRTILMVAQRYERTAERDDAGESAHPDTA